MQQTPVNGANTKPTVLYQLDASGTAVGYDQTTAAAAKAFLDTDGHGNVTAITTLSGGALACGVTYDAWGEAYDPASGNGNGLCRSGGSQISTTGNAHWYRGQVRDGSTGTYQLGSRTYDPTIGAFTTPDAYRVAAPSTDLSVGVDPTTANTYGYVNGNPVNLMDSDGHRPVCVDERSCTYTVNAQGAGTIQVKEETAEDRLQAATGALRGENDVQEDLKNSLAEAQETIDAGIDWAGIIKEAAIDLTVGDFIDCYNDPGLMSCGSAALSIIGGVLGKGAKLVDKFADGFKAVRAAKKAISLAHGTLSRATGALERSTERLSDLRAAVVSARKAVAKGDAPPRPRNPKSTRRGHDNGSDGGSCSLARSFGGNTPVLMANGTRKPIKDIRVGDKVLATDPETGEQAAKTVTHLWIHYDDLTELVLDVDLDRDGHLDRILTTEDHPFWNATDQTWQGPEEFTPGDEVIDEQWNRISVVGLDPGTTTRDLAYNLTVADIHTYHAGTADVLVHNTGDSDSCNARPFGSGKPAHEANVTVVRADGTSVTKPYLSGNMTPEEAALGFPRSTLATHTEARAVKDNPLLEGDSMIIEDIHRARHARAA